MINLFLSNKRHLLLFILLFCLIKQALSQTTEYNDKDSVFFGKSLSEIVISAFNQNKKLSDQSAAISYISSQNLNRYSPTNIASAMNAIPGVHMDLRSPGSMRINIRGSSLRAPFGVRNVKIYYNGIPLTDPGGNTYLNQLSFDDYGAIQIIKGPSGSLYGAGTGGVMLIKGPLFSQSSSPTNKITLQIGGGSFGLKKRNAHVSWGKNGNGNTLRFSDLRKDGYRNHSSMKRQTASYNTRLKLSSKEEINAFFHYTNLFYQTPGALTKKQYKQHPKASRPASSSQPSAEESKAAVYQKAFLTGIKHIYHFNSNLKNTTVLYGAYTDFTNPTTRNYELRKEPHFGGRTIFQFQHDGAHILSKYWVGAEIQQGYFSQKDFGNNSGEPDTLQLINRTNQFNSLIFAQAEWAFPHGWDLTTALSLNHQSLTFTKLYPRVATTFEKTYPLIALPRMALSKKINPHLLFYFNVSKGFSPPTVAELLPSTNILNKNLHAEKGINYELGSKGTFLHQQLYYEA
ncbi:MAG TPA: TonB-dependent receptor, partial [Chitinophagaceae bacterium]|nr:TonB-dependent receptor [Chitinophagaceae bacterium]